MQKRFGARALTIAILLAVVSILSGHKALGKGLVLGTLFSILNFILMAEFLPLRFAAERRRASALALGTLLLRYALLALPLILAAKSSAFSFVTTAAGLFMVPLVALIDSLTAGAAINHPPH
ncbi:MAG: ATP synthase subunit I [Desulfosarcinaceae bacterium]|nr:ATP synthase subunit I [Desulfosarcinaceae bacterium]